MNSQPVAHQELVRQWEAVVSRFTQNYHRLGGHLAVAPSHALLALQAEAHDLLLLLAADTGAWPAGNREAFVRLTAQSQVLESISERIELALFR